MLDFRFTYTSGDFTLDVGCRTEATTLGVFGPSGAGKTTLLHLILGLAVPLEGQLVVDQATLYSSKDNIDVPVHLRRLGMVYQDGRLFPHLRVKDNLKYARRYRSSPEPVEVDSVVDLLDIGNLLERFPGQLSGGESQRVGLGRALLSSPRLLLLDEPFTGLDKGLKQQIIPYLHAVQDTLGIPMIVVSHDLADLLQLTQYFLVMDQGRDLGSGEYLSLIRESNSLEVLRGAGVPNVLHLNAGSTDSQSGLTTLRPATDSDGQQPEILAPLYRYCETGTPIWLKLRPEDIAISLAPVADISMQNQLSGTIVEIIETEYQTLCVVDCGIQLLAEISLTARTRLALERGLQVWCLFKAQALERLSI